MCIGGMGVARACVRVILNSALGCSEVNHALSSDHCGLVSRKQILPPTSFQWVASAYARLMDRITIHSRYIGSVSSWRAINVKITPLVYSMRSVD